MFSGLLDPLRRNIGVRLSLWYALIFTLSSLALFTLTYYLLAAAIGSKDREVLEARLKEVATVYNARGLRGLEAWLESQPPEVRQTLCVRLVNVFDNVAVITAPPEWMTFQDVPSGSPDYRRRQRVIRVPRDAERDFILVSAALADGSLLQV